MAIQEFELFHGALLAKLLRNEKPMTLRLIERNTECLWGEYSLNDSVRLLVKHSKTPRENRRNSGVSWNFQLNPHEIARLVSESDSMSNWLGLVCGRGEIKKAPAMQICLLFPEDLGLLLDGRTQGQAAAITVRSIPRKELIVFRDNLELLKVPASRITSCEVPGS
jgi:hypothetical protein